MPLHDPSGTLVAEVDAVHADPRAWGAWTRLRDGLIDVIALGSPTGSPATRDAFASLGARVRVREEAGSTAYMWRLVDAALAVDAECYFLPDSDRLLHWLLAYPDELVELTRRWGRSDVLSLSRTSRAFATHPITQTLTEGPMKELIADAVGLPGADPFSGAYMLSRRAVEALCESKAPRDQSFYAEAFLAPSRAGCSFEVWPVEGLEWETPDHFRAEIAVQGYDAWLAGFQSSRQWEQRAQMMAAWVERVRVYLGPKNL